MANSNRLTHWLLSNSHRFSLSFRRLDWPLRFGLNFHDFEATLKYCDTIGIGRGTDDSPEIAIEKACSEALERLVCSELNISTVGVSLSAGPFNSKLHSYYECLERFFLKSHIVDGVPFLKSTCEVVGLKDITQFYQFSLQGPLSGIVCRIGAENSIPFYGFSLKGDLVSSHKQSFYEAAANYSRFCDSPSSFIQEQKDLNIWQASPSFISKVEPLLKLIPKDQMKSYPIPRVDAVKINCVLIDDQVRAFRSTVNRLDSKLKDPVI